MGGGGYGAQHFVIFSGARPRAAPAWGGSALKESGRDPGRDPGRVPGPRNCFAGFFTSQTHLFFELGGSLERGNVPSVQSRAPGAARVHFLRTVPAISIRSSIFQPVLAGLGRRNGRAHTALHRGVKCPAPVWTRGNLGLFEMVSGLPAGRLARPAGRPAGRPGGRYRIYRAASIDSIEPL